MNGRTLVIGDIHGCDIALETLLQRVAPAAEDTVVSLGDIIDRGPNTRRAVELLLELQSQCRLVVLMGNHEEMFGESLLSEQRKIAWLRFGGKEMCASYGGDTAAVPAEHRDFLASGLSYWETESEIYVHANLEPGVPLEEQSPHWLRWQHLTGMEFPHASGKRVICGHTGIESGLPRVQNGWVGIDTLAYRGLWLTCLEVGPDTIYQSQQSGNYRGGLTLADL